MSTLLCGPMCFQAARGSPLAWPGACLAGKGVKNTCIAVTSASTASKALRQTGQRCWWQRRQQPPAAACSATPSQHEAGPQQHAPIHNSGMLGLEGWGVSGTAAVAALGMLLCCPGAALAAEAMSAASGYNPEGGSETLKTVAGVAYIGLVVVYFVRLFRRRAQKATTERIASVADAAAYGGSAADDSDSEDEEDVKAKAVAAAEEVTPVQAAIGATQAGIIAWLLFQLCGAVDAYFDRQTLPDPYTAYTAHNIAVLVQTVCRGLVYLITFIFGANAAGLAGLSLQLMFFPDMDSGGGGRPRSRAAQLPKVSVTDDVFALRRAFEEAERMGKQEAQKQIKKSGSSDTD